MQLIVEMTEILTILTINYNVVPCGFNNYSIKKDFMVLLKNVILCITQKEWSECYIFAGRLCGIDFKRMK